MLGSSFEKLAQKGYGLKRTTQRTSEFLCCLVASVSPVCALLCVLVLPGAIEANAASLAYNLALNTSQLQATGNNYQLDFILSGVSGNTVSVTNPNFGTGSALPGQPSSITLASNPTNFGQSAVWQFTPGNHVSFTVNTTDMGPSVSGISADNIIVALEDTSGNPFPTTDPNGALFRLVLTGGADTPTLATGTGPIAGLAFTISSAGGSTGSPGTGSVPEPRSTAVIALAGLGAAGVGLLRRKPSNKHLCASKKI